MFEGVTSEGQKAADYFAKWGWYATIDAIAQGDPLKYDRVVAMSMHSFLLHLAHRSDKAKLEQQLRKV